VSLSKYFPACPIFKEEEEKPNKHSKSFIIGHPSQLHTFLFRYLSQSQDVKLVLTDAMWKGGKRIF